MGAKIFEGYTSATVFALYEKWIESWGPTSIVSTALTCNTNYESGNNWYTLIVTYKTLK